MGAIVADAWFGRYNAIVFFAFIYICGLLVMFVTSLPSSLDIGRRLAGRVADRSISPKMDDIIRYLHSRLHEDTTRDAMDSSLEADILKKIPEDVSEMYVEATTPGRLLQVNR